MTIYIVTRVDSDEAGSPFEMDCDEPWIAAEEYFEHRGSKRLREENIDELVVEVYEAVDKDGERVRFKCSRDGVKTNP